MSSFFNYVKVPVSSEDKTWRNGNYDVKSLPHHDGKSLPEAMSCSSAPIDNI